MNSKNIYLIGLMGAGKTTLGKQLANYLNRPFYDSDQLICERTGVSIPTIFELEGELGFRKREREIIDELTTLSGIVLATGGGAPLHEFNQSCLKNRGIVIYLHTTPDVLYERTRCDRNRPLLQVDNPLQKLNELYQTRDPIYRNCAHTIFEAGGSICQENLQQLLNLITSHQANSI